jgi:hypothetical protein
LYGGLVLRVKLVELDAKELLMTAEVVPPGHIAAGGKELKLLRLANLPIAGDATVTDGKKELKLGDLKAGSILRLQLESFGLHHDVMAVSGVRVEDGTENGPAPPAAAKEDSKGAVVKTGGEAKKMDFDFHKQVPPSGLKIDLSPAATVARKAVGLARPLVLSLKVTNASAQDVTTTLPHEWGGGEWPVTALYASVTPVKEKDSRAFAPVYLAGTDGGAGGVTLASGKSVELDLRTDWPGTGSVIGVPLVQKPGKYVVRFALVFEAGGRRQYAVSAPAEVESKAE